MRKKNLEIGSESDYISLEFIPLKEKALRDIYFEENVNVREREILCPCECFLKE